MRARRGIVLLLASLVVLGIFIYRNILAELLWDQAKLFHPVLLLNTDDRALAFLMGEHYFNGAGGYDINRARLAYEDTVKIDPESFMGHYQLGRVYLVLGQFDKAREEMMVASGLNPDDLRPLYVQGLIETYAGNLGLAESLFSGFLDRGGDTAWGGFNDLSWVLLQEEKYDEAASIALRGLAETDPRNPWLHNNLGVAYFNLKKYPEALLSLQNALTEAEEISDEEWFTAYSANDRGLTNLARNEFIASIHVNRALVQNALGDMSSRDSEYDKALLLLPNHHHMRRLIELERSNVDNW